jgi:hypothetical protein
VLSFRIQHLLPNPAAGCASHASFRNGCTSNFVSQIRQNEMNRMTTAAAALAIVLFASSSSMQANLRADETQSALQAIQAVGAGSSGSAAARQAMASLIQSGESSLFPVLKAFRGASPLATNWLRNTFEGIANSIRQQNGKLPETELVAFIKDTGESPAARRLAYEWLIQQNGRWQEELIPNMLLDPSPEFRRDAVAMLFEAAEASDSPQQGAMLYRRALQGAVHEDQVKKIASQLRKAGEDVDVQQHFGFLTTWKIVGPFDNKDEAGFAVPYPPETNTDPSAEYEGQLGPVSWQPIRTEDDFGVINIAEQIKNYKGSLMYATTTYESPEAREVQIRLGTPNAWKLWVNGELVFEREEYHRSTQMDQYRIPVKLVAGTNRIMVKVCQNEMTQDWAQRYQFQLRICDDTGAGLPQRN